MSSNTNRSLNLKQLR